MICYQHTLDGIEPSHLTGFFDGWPDAPTPIAHWQLLERSAHIVLAIDGEGGHVVGFVNALSDGVLSAYIPLLEVLPEHRGAGIGRELVARILEQIGPLYMIDVVCDNDVRTFYERLGFTAITGMIRRHRAAIPT
ncbi:MAG: GNAT family N-acetyltransferase [Planctomycetota bacterium]